MGWGRSADVPTVRRWERALRAERSASFELARLAARIPILRRVLGLPERLALRDDRTLEAREASVAAVRGSLVGRLADRKGDGEDRAEVAGEGRPAGRVSPDRGGARS